LITRDEIIAANPIEAYCQAQGWALTRRSGELVTCCPFHDDHNPSMRISAEKGTWFCDPCGKGGSVIDMHAGLHDMSIADALRDMAKPLERDDAPAVPAAPQVKPSFKLAKTYEYTDGHGRVLYSVDRLQCAKTGKKTFRQWHSKGGARVNGMDGVARVLWKLPKVIAADEVWLVEGEKCAEALHECALTATTNCGGSSAWMDGYADTLKGKDVVVCPDQDEAGKKWRDKVLRSLEGKVKTLRTINVPEPHNDVADFVSADGDLASLYDAATPVARGVDMPIFSAQEMVAKYREMMSESEANQVRICAAIPELAGDVRPCAPGDVVTLIAGTGVGKSTVLQAIAVSQAPQPVLFFEIELAEAIMAERYMAMTTNTTAKDVERMVNAGPVHTEAWDHVYTCPQSKITVAQIEEYIERAELKIGKRPRIVMIDYVGLIRGGKGSRYERMSEIAEDLKVLAKSTRTVVFIACQKRRTDDGGAPSLYDSKDSGSIENSSALVLGLSRPTQDQMAVKVLKQTRGPSGQEVVLPFDGERMQFRASVESISKDFDADEDPMADWPN